MTFYFLILLLLFLVSWNSFLNFYLFIILISLFRPLDQDNLVVKACVAHDLLLLGRIRRQFALIQLTILIQVFISRVDFKLHRFHLLLGQPVIISLYLCRCLCNRRLQSDKLGGLRENLDGELDDVAFAPLVPRVMLDEDLEDVPDFDNLAKEARTERSEHWIVCRRNLFLELRANR